MKLQFFLLAALLSVCVKSLPMIDKGDHYLECRGALDLGIIFDVSRSIPLRSFGTVKHALGKFLGQFTISEKFTRVGLIPFENEIHTDWGFTLDTYNSSEQISDHLERLPLIGREVRRYRALTETRKALKYVRETMLAPAVTRKGIPKVCLVMTDGNSQKKYATIREARLLREAGVDVYAMGYGRSVKISELINIAGDESRVKLERNFDNLDGIMAEMSVNVCRKVPKPKDPPCTKRDVNFVFSRSELGTSLSAKAVDTLENMAAMPRFSTGYRWGVVSGVCPVDAGFALTADVTTGLEHYRKSHLTEIVKSMTAQSYAGTENEARCNVAVLVVNESGLVGLQDNVDHIRRTGAEIVIVWNLSATDVTVERAEVISAPLKPSMAAIAIGRLLSTE